MLFDLPSGNKEEQVSPEWCNLNGVMFNLILMLFDQPFGVKEGQVSPEWCGGKT